MVKDILSSKMSMSKLSQIFKHRRSKSQGGEAESDAFDFLNKRNLHSPSVPPQASKDHEIFDIAPPYNPHYPPQEIASSSDEESNIDFESLGAKSKIKPEDINNTLKAFMVRKIEPKIASLQAEIVQANKKLGKLNSLSSRFDDDRMAERIITPPETLPTVKTGVDRNAKVKHLFSHVPNFNPNESSIRDWLLNINSAVDNADYLLSEGELKQVIITRLNDKITSMLSPWEKDKNELYRDLIHHFDVSETPEQAQAKLCTLKPDKKVHNLFEFLYESKRLLKLCPTADPRLFTMALYNFLPVDIEKELREKISNYKAHNEDKYPEMTQIIRYIMNHKDRINDHIEEQIRQKRIRAVNIKEVEKPAEKAKPQKRWCETCKKESHNTEQCFRNAVCLKCGRKGHDINVCRNRGCLFCGHTSHSRKSCAWYKDENLSSAPCSFCKKFSGLSLYHEETACIVRPSLEKNSKN